MREIESKFQQLFLIFCLDRLEDGSYVALNRRYKPVGFVSTERVDYETLPIRFKFKRALSARQIAFLSCKGDPSPERIYLYDEGCNPINSAAHWSAYSDRLSRLCGYSVIH